MAGVKSKRRADLHRRNKRAPSKSNETFVPLSTKISIGSILSVAVIVIAYFYFRHQKSVSNLRIEETLSSLLRAEQKVSINRDARIAVGFGSCQDIIVQSNQVISEPAPKYPEHFFSIADRDQFLKSFAYFYQHGAAAERYIKNSTFFYELVDSAMKAPSARHVIGGNAAVMANRFAKEGCKVLLGAQISKDLLNDLPPTVQVSGPVVEEDDVHLLLEYPAGQPWGSLIAPRANRFIVHNDHQNPTISSLELFSSLIKDFDPHLLVVSGLQMMDNFPMSPVQRNDRLIKVQELMANLSSKSKIHFEMASFSDESLLHNLVENIIPFCDSLGMNEQELPILYQVMKYGNLSLVSEAYPRIASILDQMRDVFNLLSTKKDVQRRLTRLHVHTLAFHAVMVEKRSWTNTLSAIAKSVLTANRHTCGSDSVDVSKAKLVMDNSFSTSAGKNAKLIPFDSNRPIACWEEGNIEICVAPVLVCTEVLQTGGGGDNISSAGIVLQV